jgi:diguanylate cyclase (GGDEF)-like protein
MIFIRTLMFPTDLSLFPAATHTAQMSYRQTGEYLEPQQNWKLEAQSWQPKAKPSPAAQTRLARLEDQTSHICGANAMAPLNASLPWCCGSRSKRSAGQWHTYIRRIAIGDFRDLRQYHSCQAGHFQMDYRTLFLTNIAFMTVYTASAVVLAIQNRKVRGLSLIACGLLVGLVKVVLQGTEGLIPAIFSSLVANELYLVSFVLQMLGLRWFVNKSPIRFGWPASLLGSLVLLYTALYLAHVPYIANLMNIPVIAICGYTAWMLVRRGRGLFFSVSQWAAVFLVGEMVVSMYRAVLTNQHYAMPWKVDSAQHDPHWLFSLMAMMFFSTCLLMCDFWFFVTELQRELKEQASSDPLTGALNRRALRHEGAKEVARALRSGQNLSVLMLDIDNFKELNDTLGHSAGDMALKGLVLQVKSLLRMADVIARMGGEEFLVLLPDTPREGGKIIAERIRETLQGLEFVEDGHRFHISVSVGIADLDPNLADFETLMRRADGAMYRAKCLGRNRVFAYESERDFMSGKLLESESLT